MKQTTTNHYRQRLIKVVDYMYANINGDLSVNRLADIAAMSPYHFHRIYRQLAHETVNATVRRLRLQQAAAKLISTNLPLKTIANQVSYNSLEAFSRAFTKEFDETPSEYRDLRYTPSTKMEPFIAMLPNKTMEYTTMYDIEVLELESIQLVGYKHKGDYMQIGQVFEKLFIDAGSQGIINDTTRSIGLYYDDPQSVKINELESMACISVTQPIDLKGELDSEQVVIPAGKCATLLFKGSYAELEKPYDYLFGHWLPKSGLEAANFPPFEEYLNDPKTTPPSELLTRIHCLLS
jgi:AraC family transcriptional regulator